MDSRPNENFEHLSYMTSFISKHNVGGGGGVEHFHRRARKIMQIEIGNISCAVHLEHNGGVCS